MAEGRTQRRLAAVFAADIAGYSRLVGADEDGTLARLKVLRRDLLDPKIEEQRGRIVKTTGDGLLAEFGSVVDALRCAVDVQRGMPEFDAAVDPEKRIAFRIGINVGDIVVEGGDIYGDVVNVAARLEGIAEPGGICVSARVQEDARGKLDLVFEDLGEQRLKNIAWPVKAYRVQLEGAMSAPRATSVLSEKPSIVVLPFTNMSGDPEQEYFSDEITEDIITDLSKVSAIFVIARNTAFTFKARPPIESGHLARQLKVGYVLEGSIRKAGNRIRISAKLVDGETGGNLWAERFDRDFADIFALQDEISNNVVAALRLKLLPEELKAITTRPTANALAYKFYLQARAKLAVSWGTKEYLRAARRLFAKALKADPGYARAYVGLADCDAFLWVNGDLDVSFEHMLANSGRALELAPNLAEAHASRGVALYVAGHREEAMEAFERAIELESGLYEAHYFYGFCCRETGDLRNAAVHFDRAAELQPRNYQPFTFLSEIHLVLGYPDRSAAAARLAISCIEKEFGRYPEVAEVLGMGAATMVYLGENARAEKWVNRAVLLDPESYTVRYNAACTYAVIGKLDEAQQCLEFAFSRAPRARGWLLGVAKHDTQLDPLRQRSDFQDLINRLEGNAAAAVVKDV